MEIKDLSKNKLYLFEMPDPATPSFVSFNKDYIATGNEIKDIDNEHKGLVFSVDKAVKVVGESKIIDDVGKSYFEFLNIYGFPYYIGYDTCEMHFIYTGINNKYMRFVKAVIKNFHMVDKLPSGETKNIYYTEKEFWGNPVLRTKNTISGMRDTADQVNSILETKIYCPDKLFDTYEDMLKDMRHPSESTLGFIMDEILADG